MTPCDGGIVGGPLCELLGLRPECVYRLQIDMRPGHVVEITATLRPSVGFLEEIQRVFRMAEWREVE